MNLKKLEKLNELRKNGALTDAEFQQEKQKLMNEETNTSASGDIPFNLTENTYMGLMNLIVLLPYIGWILSIVAWILGKEKSEKIDIQGKNILNWMISYLLYGIGLFIIMLFISVIAGIAMFGTGMGMMADHGMGFNMGGLGILGVLGTLGTTLGAVGFSGFGLVVFLFILILPIIGAIKGFNGNTFRYPLTISFIK
ncbi:MAG: DUF4870 domain-containing protein [Bacteroidales bacterium]|nr:DUF4870 domain-containing protein [Bacteroidales bacterium]